MTRAAESVDVIIPVFNGASTIATAIDSVVAQKGTNIGHIIIVDDGSTDGTSAVVNSMHLPSVKLITTKNRGVAAARNTGLSNATSDWIAFLDADDCWSSDKLQAQLDMARQHQVSFVCSAAEPNCKKPEGKITCISLWRGNFIATSSVLVKREIAQCCKPLFSVEMTFAEDYAAWFKILAICTGYFTSISLTMYAISPTPHYRLWNIFRNLLILQKECISFIVSSNVSFAGKIFAVGSIIAGSAISTLSIFKRFYLAHSRSV